MEMLDECGFTLMTTTKYLGTPPRASRAKAEYRRLLKSAIETKARQWVNLFGRVPGNREHATKAMADRAYRDRILFQETIGRGVGPSQCLETLTVALGCTFSALYGEDMDIQATSLTESEDECSEFQCISAFTKHLLAMSEQRKESQLDEIMALALDLADTFIPRGDVYIRIVSMLEEGLKRRDSGISL